MAKTMTTVRHKDSKFLLSKPSAKSKSKTSKKNIKEESQNDVMKRLIMYRKMTKRVTFAEGTFNEDLVAQSRADMMSKL